MGLIWIRIWTSGGLFWKP